MLKISKKVEYALMALKFMAFDKNPGELTQVRELCDRFNVPFDTMAKVMQTLNNAKIIKSHQGVKGGHELIKGLSEVSYFEVYRLIEGQAFGASCNGPKSHCDQFETCNIIGPLHRLNDRLTNFFQEVKLDELLCSEDNFTCNHTTDPEADQAELNKTSNKQGMVS